MIHEAIKAELVAQTATSAYLAGNPDRIYPLVIPQKVPGGADQLPCVVYDTRGVDRAVTYCGTIKLVRAIITLDCYATSYDESKELAAAVRGVLLDYRGQLGGLVEVRTANIETEFDLQDIEPGLYRVAQSWGFWYVEE